MGLIYLQATQVGLLLDTVITSINWGLLNLIDHEVDYTSVYE